MTALFQEVLPRTVASFEKRPQQLVMATEISKALESSDHLIIEAPTGVGKSLAYLVPALLFATGAHRSGIISTHTRNLQEQLLRKDLPVVRAALKIPFEAAVLKGRRNYLCPARLMSVLASPGALFDQEGERQLAALQAWAASTPDGEIDHLDFAVRPDVWEMVCSEPGVCSGSSCGARCFHRRAYERARRADLVIMNHALYFALFAAEEGEDRAGFENAFVIFDEAHTLEAVASAGSRVSRSGLLRQLQHLYDPRTRRGVLARTKPGGRTAAGRALRAAGAFWESVRALAGQRPNAHRAGDSLLVRLRHPLLSPTTLEPVFAELHEMLLRMTEASAEPALQKELAVARRQLRETELRLADLLDCADPGATYWVEWHTRPRSAIALCSAPIDVGQTMQERVFRDGIPVILTSASLAVGGDLRYYSRRIGAGATPTLVLDSPFDHRRQMRIALPRGCPDPHDPTYLDSIPGWILESIRRSRGRALVLFTSAVSMHAAAEALSAALAAEGIHLLVQGIGAQRDQLLEEFRRDASSVLFGLDSFWFGVDVSGKALEHVIIVRLPFPVPAHPVIEARLEAIRSEGGHPFLEYMLPEAVLKLRQGVGRLIRSATDRGMVTILDSRILKKSYGRVFLASLPHCPVELWTPGSDPEEIDTAIW